VVLPARDSAQNTTVSFTNPLLEFGGARPGETVAIQFDRGASNFSLGESTKSEEGLEVGSLEFFLRAGDSIRFWEKGGAQNDGAQVAKAIGAAEADYRESRPRLGGEWSAWDETMIGNGAWWLQVLTDSSFSLKSEADPIIRLARLVAPDLVPKLEGPPAEPEASRPVIEGLNAALKGLLAVESKLQEKPEGGLDLLFGPVVAGEYRLDHYPLGGDRFEILCNPNELRIADSSGTFLAFDSPGTVRGFRVDDAGNWSGAVAMNRPTTLRAGPAERVLGVLWNEAPLLLVREGDRFQGRLPSATGEIRLALKKDKRGKP
jgi:hypothetical protein